MSKQTEKISNDLKKILSDYQTKSNGILDEFPNNFHEKYYKIKDKIIKEVKSHINNMKFLMNSFDDFEKQDNSTTHQNTENNIDLGNAFLGNLVIPEETISFVINRGVGNLNKYNKKLLIDFDLQFIQKHQLFFISDDILNEPKIHSNIFEFNFTTFMIDEKLEGIPILYFDHYHKINEIMKKIYKFKGKIPLPFKMCFPFKKAEKKEYDLLKSKLSSSNNIYDIIQEKYPIYNFSSDNNDFLKENNGTQIKNFFHEEKYIQITINELPLIFTRKGRISVTSSDDVPYSFEKYIREESKNSEKTYKTSESSLQSCWNELLDEKEKYSPQLTYENKENNIPEYVLPA